MTLSPTRGRTHWRHGGGRKRNFLRTIISPGQCSLLELQAWIERWESYVSRYEKKLKDKLDDEIKLAGLESLVPEDLEKHLILNSNRLRTFEDARLEVVTYVEAQFSLRIRDSKPSDTGARGHSDPTDVDAVNSLSRQAKEDGHQVRSMGVLGAVQHILNETAMHAKAQASNRMAKANRASHGPRVRTKARLNKTLKNPKENPKEPKVRTKVLKACTRTKYRKLVSQVLETRNQRPSSEIQESAQTDESHWCDDGWSYEWKDDWSSVGWHEGWERTYDTSASPFSVNTTLKMP